MFLNDGKSFFLEISELKYILNKYFFYFIQFLIYVVLYLFNIYEIRFDK